MAFASNKDILPVVAGADHQNIIKIAMENVLVTLSNVMDNVLMIWWNVDQTFVFTHQEISGQTQKTTEIVMANAFITTNHVMVHVQLDTLFVIRMDLDMNIAIEMTLLRNVMENAS